MIFSTESARATLLQRGDASRGSSTESARATLLKRDDASRGSSTESARAIWLKRNVSPVEDLQLSLARATFLQLTENMTLGDAETKRLASAM